jgi:hypothetical protein
MTDTGDRNAVIQLISGPKSLIRIKTIHYSYGLSASNLVAVFIQGRLIVAEGKPPRNLSTEIAPSFYDDPKVTLGATDILLDINLKDATGRLDFGEEGIRIAEGKTVYVMLTGPETTTETSPDFDDMIGSLAVYGTDQGMGNPYPNLR